MQKDNLDFKIVLFYLVRGKKINDKVFDFYQISLAKLAYLK